MHVATNFERTSLPRTEGGYTIPQLPVGIYVVIITATGFQTTTLENIEVTAGSTVRVDGKLAIGGLQDAVTVSAEARQIQTDSVKVTTAISSKFIQDLPLVVGGQLRSPLDLSLIAPEAKTGNSGDGARGNIVIGGGQEGGWDLTVDGVSATPGAPFEQRLWTTLNSPVGRSHHRVRRRHQRLQGGVRPRRRRRGELRVALGHQSMARQGLRVHARRRASTTNNFFSKALGRAKPQVSQHDFGGVFGGPVVLPEDVQRQGQDVLLRLLRGLSQQDVGGAANGDHPGRRRCTTATSRRGATRAATSFPSTIRRRRGPTRMARASSAMRSPTTRFRSTASASISREVIQLATMRPDLGGVRNNFAYTPGDQINTNPWNKFSLKLDHNLSTKDRLGFLLHWGEVLVVPPSDGPGGGLPVPLNNFRDEDSHTYVYRFNWDRVITPGLLNRVTFGHNNWYQLRASFNRDQGWGTTIGLQNVPGPDLLFPLIDFSDDYLDWGRSEWGGSGNYLWALSDDLTWVKSSHTWKFGFIVQQDHYDGYGWHTAAGTYNFNRGATAGFLANGNLDTTGASGNAFASFLLGEVQSSEITTNRYVSDRWRYYSGYAQDDWRISDKLTLNYGVRYEYTPPTWEGHFPDGYSNFNPNLPNPGGGRPARRIGVRRRGRGAHRARRRCTRRGRGGSARASASSTA